MSKPNDRDREKATAGVLVDVATAAGAVAATAATGGDPHLALAIVGAREVGKAAAKSVMGRFLDRFRERGEQRVEDFYRMIREGVPPDRMSDLATFLETADAREVHQSLVEAIVNDSEEEKIPYYARLQLRLALYEKQKEGREILIRLTRALTKRDIEMLLLVNREMWRIANESPPAKAGHLQSGWLARTRRAADEWGLLAFQNLETNGLLAFGDQPFVTVFGTELGAALAPSNE